jgi:hypothetical protein
MSPLILEEPPRAFPVRIGRVLPPSDARGVDFDRYTVAFCLVKLLEINGTLEDQVFVTGPRSRSNTLILGFSLRREATTQPAVPPE